MTRVVALAQHKQNFHFSYSSSRGRSKDVQFPSPVNEARGICVCDVEMYTLELCVYMLKSRCVDAVAAAAGDAVSWRAAG